MDARSDFAANGSSTITIGTLDVTAPNYIRIPASGSGGLTVNNAIAWTASGKDTIRVESNGGNQGVITVPAGSTINQGNFTSLLWTGTTTATNSFSLGRISGQITITGPTSIGGSGAGIIGG